MGVSRLVEIMGRLIGHFSGSPPLKPHFYTDPYELIPGSMRDINAWIHGPARVLRPCRRNFAGISKRYFRGHLSGPCNLQNCCLLARFRPNACFGYGEMNYPKIQNGFPGCPFRSPRNLNAYHITIWFKIRIRMGADRPKWWPPFEFHRPLIRYLNSLLFALIRPYAKCDYGKRISHIYTIRIAKSPPATKLATSREYQRAVD